MRDVITEAKRGEGEESRSTVEGGLQRIGKRRVNTVEVRVAPRTSIHLAAKAALTRRCHGDELVRAKGVGNVRQPGWISTTRAVNHQNAEEMGRGARQE